MFELLDAVLPTLGVLTILVLAVAIIAVVVIVLVGVPRSRRIGGRAHGHAVLLSMLPSSSHPDAAGHARSRAPGISPAVA
ncbi:MAG TPA: DUF6412 domain-containing protein [Pseudolysinimonas sp.]